MDFLFLTSGGANSKSLRWILQAAKFPRFGEKSDRVFHYYLVTRMTDWAQTLTGVLFHVCVGSHKVRTLIFAIYQCCGMALNAKIRCLSSPQNTQYNVQINISQLSLWSLIHLYTFSPLFCHVPHASNCVVYPKYADETVWTSQLTWQSAPYSVTHQKPAL